MMKGYSAEEARVAARRASARPPPPATAYASTRDKVRCVTPVTPHTYSTLLDKDPFQNFYFFLLYTS